eukprot:GHVS01108671.1.p1 GENE.GHVS01108671.1~~GHVS01108671.1.p1  ORF type:complete len:184 (-),score=40.06 GHVS01108671.1:385-936(-)
MVAGGDVECQQPPTSELSAQLKLLDGSFFDSSLCPAAHDWCYLDMSGQLQGPYTTPTMLRWLEMGYFQPTTQLRRDDEKGFTPLDDGGRIKFTATTVVNYARAVSPHCNSYHPPTAIAGPTATAVPPPPPRVPPPPSHPMSLKAKVESAQHALAPLFDLARKQQRQMPGGPEIIKKRKLQFGK